MISSGGFLLQDILGHSWFLAYSITCRCSDILQARWDSDRGATESTEKQVVESVHEVESSGLRTAPSPKLLSLVFVSPQSCVMASALPTSGWVLPKVLGLLSHYSTGFLLKFYLLALGADLLKHSYLYGPFVEQT